MTTEFADIIGAFAYIALIFGFLIIGVSAARAYFWWTQRGKG